MSVLPGSHHAQDWTCSQWRWVLRVHVPSQISTLWSFCLPPISVRHPDRDSSLAGVVGPHVWAGDQDNDYSSRRGSLWKEHWIWTSREEPCGGVKKCWFRPEWKKMRAINKRSYRHKEWGAEERIREGPGGPQQCWESRGKGWVLQKRKYEKSTGRRLLGGHTHDFRG